MTTSATAVILFECALCVLLRLRLPPATEVVRSTVNDAACRRASVTKPANPHVHRRGFTVPLSLAPREKLLEHVREQLVGSHVPASRYELTGRDLVQNGSGLVIPGGLADDVPFELVDRTLQATAVSRGSRATWCPPICATESVISIVAYARSTACRAAGGRFASAAPGRSSLRATCM